MNENSLEKYDKDEPIQIGDLITYFPETNKITRAVVRNWKKVEHNDIMSRFADVIGVCTNVDNDIVTFVNQGIVKVNVKGLVCLGDKLTLSEDEGIAVAIKYNQDDTRFGIRPIGKVIELYNDYSVVKVLLDIE